jgi:hypothetical protein
MIFFAIPIPAASCYDVSMKTSLRPLAPTLLLLLTTGCGSVHWGDYFNAGGGPPEQGSNLPPPKTETPSQPTLDEQGRRTFR